MSLNYSLNGLVKLQWSEIEKHFEGIEKIKINTDGSIHILANEYSDELKARDDSHIHLGEGVDVSVKWLLNGITEYSAFTSIADRHPGLANNVTTLNKLDKLPAYIWDTVINGLLDSTITFDPEISGMVVSAGARGTFIIGMAPNENTVMRLTQQGHILNNIKNITINNAFTLYSRDLQKATFGERTRDELCSLWENIRFPQHNLTIKLPVTNMGGGRYKVTDGNGDEFTFANPLDFMWWLAKNVYNT